MLVGWWEFIRNPRGRRKSSGADEFVLVKPRKLSLGKILGSKENQTTTTGRQDIILKPTGILLSPETESRVSVPEPGDVTRRHETTNLFEGDDEEDDGERRGRGRGLGYDVV
jgi:hypothetical protein